MIDFIRTLQKEPEIHKPRTTCKKITEAQKVKIRGMLRDGNKTQAAIADEMGVSCHSVHMIKTKLLGVRIYNKGV